MFFAELQLMIMSTYFIGTFNSNIGNLVSLSRGCTRRKYIVGGSSGNAAEDGTDELDIVQIANQLNHFYNSHGVDRDEWSFF